MIGLSLSCQRRDALREAFRKGGGFESPGVAFTQPRLKKALDRTVKITDYLSRNWFGVP
jgi:hypothetical protein